MFSGWNPTGTEASFSIHLHLLVQYTYFKTLPLNELSTYCLGQYVYPLENEDFSIIWYLEVADPCKWELQGCHNTAGLL